MVRIGKKLQNAFESFIKATEKEVDNLELYRPIEELQKFVDDEWEKFKETDKFKKLKEPLKGEENTTIRISLMQDFNSVCIAIHLRKKLHMHWK
jgi:hypothetical protein